MTLGLPVFFFNQEVGSQRGQKWMGSRVQLEKLILKRKIVIDEFPKLESIL